MIDTEKLSESDRQFAAVLDTLDRLKKLRAPRDPKMSPEMKAWFESFENAISTLPDIGDPDQLTRTGEDIDAVLSMINQKADMALSMMGQEQDEDVLLPEPAMLSASVVECYDSTGAVWIDTQHHADGAFAAWCKANPCNADGTIIDTSTEIIIKFPFATTSAEDPAGYYSYPITGVIFCPPGTLINYFPYPIAEITGGGAHPAFVGIEAGERLGLPFVAFNGTTWDGSEWITEDFPVFEQAGIAADGSSVSFYHSHRRLDPFGRLVGANNSPMHGITFTATVTIDDVPYPVAFSGPVYPPA